MKLELSEKGFELVHWAMFGLMTIIFLNLNGVSNYFSGAVALLSPLILILAIFSIISLIKRGMFYADFLIFWYIVAMVVLLTIGMINDFYDPSWLHPKSNPLTTLKSMASSVVIVFCFYLYVNYLYKINKQEVILKQLFYYALIMSVLIIVLPLMNIQLSLDDLGGRRNGLFGNPNEAGIVSNIAFALILYFILSTHKNKFIYIVLLFIPLVSTVLTFSKSAMLVAFFILLYFFFYSFIYSRLLKDNNKIWIRVLFILFILLIFVLYINVDFLFDNLSYAQLSRLDQLVSFTQGNIDENTTSDRNILFEEAWNMIKAKPWTGYGLATFSRLKHIGLGCHNSFVLIWGEGGILSILLWLCFFLFLGLRLFYIRNMTKRFICLMLFLIIVLQGFIPTHNLLEFKYLAAIFGILIAILHNEELAA